MTDKSPITIPHVSSGEIKQINHCFDRECSTVINTLFPLFPHVSSYRSPFPYNINYTLYSIRQVSNPHRPESLTTIPQLHHCSNNCITLRFKTSTFYQTSVISSAWEGKLIILDLPNSRSIPEWDRWKSAYGGGDCARVRSMPSYLSVESRSAPLAMLVPIPLSTMQNWFIHSYSTFSFILYNNGTEEHI